MNIFFIIIIIGYSEFFLEKGGLLQDNLQSDLEAQL